MVAARKPFQGTLQILRYNWSFYVFGAIGLIVAAAILAVLPLPGAVVTLALLGILLGVWWLSASIIASYWIYDASELMQWRWLSGFVEPPRTWVNIHSGLDESTPTLAQMWGEPTAVWDIFDDREMTEVSILRARATAHNEIVPTRVQYASLPAEDGSIELASVIFSAHELRSETAREAFFKELTRILCGQGQLILIEHVRDAANFTVFGPGFMHFFPLTEWRRLGIHAGLHLKVEERITPFVRFQLWEKP